MPENCSELLVLRPFFRDIPDKVFLRSNGGLVIKSPRGANVDFIILGVPDNNGLDSFSSLTTECGFQAPPKTRF